MSIIKIMSIVKISRGFFRISSIFFLSMSIFFCALPRLRNEEIYMKKKVLFIIVVLFLVIGAGAFADHPDGLGIGLDLTYGYNGGLGPALSLKLPSIPIFWTLSMGISSEWFLLMATGDYYFIDKPLVPDIDLGWYLGLGLYFNLMTWKGGDLGLGLGARLPIGLSWQPRQVDILELFFDVAPSLGLALAPVYFPQWDVNVDFGIRFWF
jgi:hypothetical protein